MGFTVATPIQQKHSMTQHDTVDYKCFLQNRANKTKHHSGTGKTYIYYIQK